MRENHNTAVVRNTRASDLQHSLWPATLLCSPYHFSDPQELCLRTTTPWWVATPFVQSTTHQWSTESVRGNHTLMIRSTSRAVHETSVTHNKFAWESQHLSDSQHIRDPRWKFAWKSQHLSDSQHIRVVHNTSVIPGDPQHLSDPQHIRHFSGSQQLCVSIATPCYC